MLRDRPETVGEDIVQTLGGKRTARGWTVHCPAHDDQHPSLDLTVRNGKLLFICRAGCPQESVLLALRENALWPEDWRVSGTRSSGTPLRVAAPLPPLAGPARKLTGRFEYRGTAGELIAIKERYEFMDRGEPSKSFVWLRPNGEEKLKGAVPLLYRTETLVAASPEAPIDLVEGEKCVHAMEQAGRIAVCGPNGASTAKPETWKPYVGLLRGRTVILWPDNNPEGRQHMQAAAAALFSVAAEVRIVSIPGLPEKGDVTDYLAAGHTPADLAALAEAAEHWSPKGRFHLPQFMQRTLQPPRWAIEGVLPDGLTIVAGKPKMGKSLAMLGQSLAIASGGWALGKIPVEVGDVLYIALEDAERLLQDRTRQLLAGQPPPERMDLWTECPGIADGGLQEIDGWLREHPQARLVVIDTLERIRPRSGSGSVYSDDYAAVAPLADLSHQHQVAIVVVHHLRKAGAEDPLDMLSGSTGLAAAADGLLILQRSRGDADAELHVILRAGMEQKLALRFDETTAEWALIGDAVEYRMSKERREIVEVLEGVDPMTPGEIAEILDKPPGSIRRLLSKMTAAGEVQRADRRYTVPSSSPETLAPLACDFSQASAQIPLPQAENE